MKIVILDEQHHIEDMAEKWARIKSLIDATDGVNIVDHKTTNTTQGDSEMFHSRSLLAAALMSGLVVAHGPGGAAIAPHRAIQTVESFEDRRRGKGKGRFNHRPSGAAAAKRVKAKRRNVRARASKRA